MYSSADDLGGPRKGISWLSVKSLLSKSKYRNSIVGCFSILLIE